MGDTQATPDEPAGASEPDGQPDAVSMAGGAVDIATLVAEHHADLYRYAFRLCGTQADAEDLVQQTYLIAQQRLHQLRQAERARWWLFAILRSCFLKELRRHLPTAASTIDLDINSVPGAEETSEVDPERLQRALNELPGESRLIVSMFYFENASYKEIADQLDLKLGTVMSRLARAKQKLRHHLFRISSAAR